MEKRGFNVWQTKFLLDGCSYQCHFELTGCGQVAEPSDVSSVVLYLLSDGAEMVTGESIRVTFLPYIGAGLLC